MCRVSRHTVDDRNWSLCYASIVIEEALFVFKHRHFCARRKALTRFLAFIEPDSKSNRSGFLDRMRRP